MKNREESRLVLSRIGDLERRFKDIVDYLKPGLFALNDTCNTSKAVWQ